MVHLLYDAKIREKAHIYIKMVSKIETEKGDAYAYSNIDFLTFFK